MESAETKIRLRLLLGKFQVKWVNPGVSGMKFALDMGNAITLNGDCPIRADIRVGDLLTLYTEVLADEPPNAKPV